MRRCSAPDNRGPAKDKWTEFAGVIDNTSIHKLQQAVSRENGNKLHCKFTYVMMAILMKKTNKKGIELTHARADHARLCPPEVFESIGCTNAATEAVIGYRLPFSFNSASAVLEEVTCYACSLDKRTISFPWIDGQFVSGAQVVSRLRSEEAVRI